MSFSLLLSCLFFTIASFASIEIIDAKKESVSFSENGLKEFSIEVLKKKVILQDESEEQAFYLTDIRSAYQTNSLASLTDYAIVQYIRGCQFESQWDGNKEQRILNISRRHFNETKVFQHKSWEVDSDSLDPIYSAFENYGRFSLLRWNEDPSSFDPATATYYFQEKPPHPVAFITDLPGGATRLTPLNKKSRAKNVSLEFKICIFSTKDLPLSTDPSGSNFTQEKAHHCFFWEHKFIYNFQGQKFESPKTIPDICLN